MLLVGLTGGIGSGKSTVAGMLAARGAVIVIGRRSRARPSRPARRGSRPSVGAFGDEVVAPDGELDRARSRRGSSPTRRRAALERSCTPRSRRRFARASPRRRHRSRGRRGLAAPDRDRCAPRSGRRRRVGVDAEPRSRASPPAAWTRPTPAPAWPRRCDSRTRRRSPTSSSTTRAPRPSSRRRSTACGPICRRARPGLMARRRGGAGIIRRVRFRAVFFDVGETLVHAHPSFAELFADVLARAGHPVAWRRSTTQLPIVCERFSEAARDDDCGRPRRIARARSGPPCTSGCSRASGCPDDGLTSTLHREFTDRELRPVRRRAPALGRARAAPGCPRHRVELRGVARGLLGGSAPRRLPRAGDQRDRGDGEAGPAHLPARARAGGGGGGGVRVRRRQPRVRRRPAGGPRHVPRAHRPPRAAPTMRGARIRHLRELPGVLEAA